MMASSIFRNSLNSNISNKVNGLKSMGSSNAVFNQMYSTNPNFRAFANSMRGKSPEQAFRENGLDFSAFRDYRW